MNDTVNFFGNTRKTPTLELAFLTKKNSIQENFNLAQKPGAEMFINHLNAYKSPLSTPQDFADVCNRFMSYLIRENKPKYLGIVVVDYPDSTLITVVIRTNDELRNYQFKINSIKLNSTMNNKKLKQFK